MAILLFGVLLCLPGIIMTATGFTRGMRVAGGIFIAIGVVILIIGTCSYCQARKLASSLSYPQVAVQRTSIPCTPVTTPAYPYQLPVNVHPKDTMYQYPQAHSPPQVYLAASNIQSLPAYPSQPVSVYPPLAPYPINVPHRNLMPASLPADQVEATLPPYKDSIEKS